jgi:hypothetical protein
MNELLVAIALVAAFSMPASAALRKTKAKPEYRQSMSKQQERSQTGHSKANDPYWEPCYVSHYGGRNTCD